MLVRKWHVAPVSVMIVDAVFGGGSGEEEAGGNVVGTILLELLAKG